MPREEESATLKDAMSFVVGRKFPLPKQWSGEDLDKLEFPSDLTRLTSSQLGELLGVWASVMAYAQYEAARTDIERTARWNRYDMERKTVYLQIVAEKGFTEEGRKAKVHVKTAVLLKKYEQAKAEYTLTNALLGVYSKYYQALSRELSRRGLDGNEPVSSGGPVEDDLVGQGKVETSERLTKEWAKDGS